MKEKEIKVYIASPYSAGWMPQNITRQFDLSKELLELGYWPYMPLLTHFLELYPHYSEQVWLQQDFIYLKVCDAVLRIKPVDDEGVEIPSPGADKEVALAEKEGIPVFYSIEELNNHFKANSKQGEILYFDPEELKKKWIDLATDI
jgi:hypothetical protein